MKKLFLLILNVILITTYSKGQTWEPMETTVTFNAYCFAEYKGELYAGTSVFDEIKGVAKLEGNKWVNLGLGISHGSKIAPDEMRVEALAVCKGELYAGGIFGAVGGKQIYGIARWNGTEWNTVGEKLLGNPYPIINKFKVNNDVLYAWGTFSFKMDGKEYYNSGKWDGEKWMPIVQEDFTDSLKLAGSFVYNNEHYWLGQLNNKEGNYAYYVLKWNGTKYERLPKQIGGENGISNMTLYNNTLFAAEAFFQHDDYRDRNDFKRNQIRSVKKWNGTEWVSCGVFDMPVQSMYSYKGELLVSGLFKEIGGKKIKFMAKYKE